MIFLFLDPSSSKDESGLNDAIESPNDRVQVFHYTQQQQQMMGQQRPGGPAAALPPPPPPPPHPLSSSSDLRGGGAGGSALLWEPRDPPLQYSGVSSTTASTTQAHLHHNLRMQQQQHHHHHPPAMAGIIGHHQVSKTRLEPRRSASLSQADLVVYDGKMLGRLQQSQSPAIRSPPTASAVSAVSLDPLSSSSSSSQKQQQHVARYHDYYETKYEKPVRLTSAIGSSSITNITGSNSGVGAGRSTAGVDVDTVWKSRWRSTSPPPAPVDDWLPIKPPQLAWAKPAPVVAQQQQQHVSSSSNSNGSSSRTTSRIPIASGSTAGSTLLMARSMSGDMDHMIYLDRDMQVPPLSMRERTRSIDRGLAQQQQQQPPPPSSSHGGNKRQQFKTYEEELADYHGRTGSVDRLATAAGQQQYNSLQHQQKRGRQRNNIRMGIGLSQVQQQLGLTGLDRRVSLERRHSEVGLNTSSSSGGGGGGRRREASGGDSSNSSSGGGGGRRSNSNDNNQQFKKIIPTTRPSPPRSVSHGNVNRVYLDGPPDTYAVSRSSQPASSSAIRVTMTETRSLKRPSTNRVATPVTSSAISGAGGGATVGESSTMPRMSKRHHGSSPPQVQQQQQQQQGKSSLPSAQHPGSTTVYLAGGDDPFRKPQQQQLQQPPRTPQKDSTKSAAAAATGVSSTSIIASAAPLTDASSTGKPCCCLRFNRHGGAGSSQSAFYFHLSPLQQTVL